jgi:glycosyltransferase involved in cell wall biosynthesis
LESSNHPPLEVIIVDDGSQDGSPALAASHGHRVIRTSVPRSGPAAARNLGAEAAQGDVLFFIDADVAVAPSTTGLVAEAFDSNPELDALFGSYDDEPAEENFISQYKNLFNHYVHQHGNEEATTFWAACGAIRRSVFLERGGFDSQRYPQPSIEDIELGYRLKESGVRIRLVKAIQVKHLKCWSFTNLLRTDIFYRGIPWMRLLLERRFLVRDLNLDDTNRYSIATAYLALAISFIVPAFSHAVSAVGAGCLLLLVLNRDLYLWFANKRGVLFAAKAVPVHWLYYLYSGFALTAGTVLHLASLPGNSRRRGAS